MDAANLTFAHIFLTILGSFLVGGVGLAIGWRVLPITKTHLKGETIQPGEKAIEKSIDTTKAGGRLFPTEVLGLEGNVIRYRDGSFAKAYRFEPANTLYDDERLTEQRIEELKTLLKFEKPDKTIIQFRFVNKPDDGRALRNHLNTRNSEKSDSLASLLQATNLALYEEAIRSGEIKTQTATVWIRVPTRHLDDKSIFSRFVPSLLREIKMGGFWRFLFAPVISGKNAFAQAFLAREVKAEKYCRQTAQKVFQAFEANFPKELNLRELARQEVFDEMFLSHRREHTAPPKLPDQKRIDVRRYLTSAEIECDETNYLLHNGALASLVSLKTLPQGFVTADALFDGNEKFALSARNYR
jgi:hypothetical protein